MSPNPQDADALHRVVLAGMKLMYAPQVFPMFKQALEAGGPLPQVLAAQAAGLMKILMDKANGSIPKQVVIPAGAMLLAEMADFMRKAKLASPSEQDMQAAVKLLVNLLVKVFAGGQSAPGAAPAPGNPVAAPAGAPPAASAGPAPQPGMIGGM
jgi:hypothetical protein